MKEKASAAVGARNLLGREVAPQSGLCAVCSRQCVGYCEVGMSARLGKKPIYPEFGNTTSGAAKEFPVSLGDLQIMGSNNGVDGLENPSPDTMLFSNVDLATTLGRGDNAIKISLPLVVPGLGSTYIAKRNWTGLACGLALSGVPLVIGENVVGSSRETEIKEGQIVDAPKMRYRVEAYQRWMEMGGGHGAVVVQENVEDNRFGVHPWVIEKLGVEIVEIKDGQGAKCIGGEVMTNELEKALFLKKRGYLVIPDPEDSVVQEAKRMHIFEWFERHSRVGSFDPAAFIKRVENLRSIGAKQVWFKTGAYRLRDIATVLKACCEAKVDVVTIDGAGGGTGMSPWRMMQHWGIPTVYLMASVREMLRKLEKNYPELPSIVVAGGMALEDHLVKALALGDGYFTAVGMGRALLTASMVGKKVGRELDIKEAPDEAVTRVIGRTFDEALVHSREFKAAFPDVEKVLTKPADLGSAIAVWTFINKRLAQGFQQFLAGARKFNPGLLNLSDVAALTREAADVSGASFIMDVDRGEIDQILGV